MWSGSQENILVAVVVSLRCIVAFVVAAEALVVILRIFFNFFPTFFTNDFYSMVSKRKLKNNENTLFIGNMSKAGCFRNFNISNWSILSYVLLSLFLLFSYRFCLSELDFKILLFIRLEILFSILVSLWHSLFLSLYCVYIFYTSEIQTRHNSR